MLSLAFTPVSYVLNGAAPATLAMRHTAATMATALTQDELKKMVRFLLSANKKLKKRDAMQRLL